MDPITLFAAAAFGALIGQGGHELDGFRGTGCDPAEQRAVISERTGEVLYWNNPTCPAGSGATDVAEAELPDDEDENGNGKKRR